MHGHVYKSLLRGCLKRPQRNSQNLPGNCSNCEETRKYIKSSIELYRHFSNPALNRRWICRACDTDNNSVTWHCVICDQVSYLAPIYKGQHEATATTGGVVQLELNSVGANSDSSEKHQQQQQQHQQQQRQSSKELEEHEEPTQYHNQHSNKRQLLKGVRRVVSTSSSTASHSHFRRTQSLSASIDKASVAASASSASGRSCHICHVNNLSKDIFNLPIETPLNYPHKPSK